MPAGQVSEVMISKVFESYQVDGCFEKGSLGSWGWQIGAMSHHWDTHIRSRTEGAHNEIQAASQAADRKHSAALEAQRPDVSRRVQRRCGCWDAHACPCMADSDSS
jgi:hypothetical protein